MQFGRDSWGHIHMILAKFGDVFETFLKLFLAIRPCKKSCKIISPTVEGRQKSEVFLLSVILSGPSLNHAEMVVRWSGNCMFLFGGVQELFRRVRPSEQP